MYRQFILSCQSLPTHCALEGLGGVRVAASAFSRAGAGGVVLGGVMVVAVLPAVRVERASFDVRLGERNQIWSWDVGRNFCCPTAYALKHPDAIVIAETVVRNCRVGGSHGALRCTRRNLRNLQISCEMVLRRHRSHRGALRRLKQALLLVLLDDLSQCRVLWLEGGVCLSDVLLNCHVSIDVGVSLGWGHFVNVDGTVLGERSGKVLLIDFFKL